MISLPRALALLALALPLAAPAPAQRPIAGLLGAQPLERRFGDWLLACDNVRVCRAQVTGQDGSLMIRRDPGPTGAVRVVLDGQDPADGPSIPEIASIRVIGGAAPGGWRLDRAGENARLEGQAALTFVWAVAGARTLTYRAGGRARSVSLTGLTATLLAMDEAQGRTGTVTASVRPGPRPVTIVPPVLTVPVLWVPRPSTVPLPRNFAASVRRANAAALRRADCEADRAGADEAVPLSRTEALVFLGCRLYNTSAGTLLLRVQRADPRRATLVRLPRTPGEDGADGTGVYSDLEWDAATASLSSGGHSCAGSCGQRSSWAFDGQTFRLASHLIYEWGGAEGLDLYRTNVRIRR
jgi:hypothetical protein